MRSRGWAFRSGIEPVLLAVASRRVQGSRMLEAGSGAGAMLLCLAARVAGIRGLGIEQDPALVALARQNAAANGWPDLHFMAADIASPPRRCVRPRLRQSAVPRRSGHAVARRVSPDGKARDRRNADALGHRPGAPAAATRHIDLHPRRPRCSAGDGGICRRRLRPDRHAAAVAETRQSGKAPAAARHKGQPRALPRTARNGAACAQRRASPPEADAILRGGAPLAL